jgi:hypothetical protein
MFTGGTLLISGEFSGFYKLVREGETDERLDRAANLCQ